MAKRAQILEVFFQPELAKGAPSGMYARVQNLTTLFTDYLLRYTITTPSSYVITGEKPISDLSPFQSTLFLVDPAFTPIEFGMHHLRMELRSASGVVLYDTYDLNMDVRGEHALTFTISAPSEKSALGLSYPFTVNLFNSGDFQEDNVRVDWYVVDAQQLEYGRSATTLSLSAGETRALEYAPFIPLHAGVGIHTVYVNVYAYNTIQSKTVHFGVTTPNEYYAQLLADLEWRADQLEKTIDDMQRRGFDIADARTQLLAIQSDLAQAKGKLLAGDFETLGPLLIDISTRLSRLGALLATLEQQSPLLSREGLTMLLILGVILLLALLIWFRHHYTHQASALPNPLPKI
ncbi:MAG: hypothetical protein U1C71_02140, partial [archaeon]|nr:hypothetical protein [archaeon]